MIPQWGLCGKQNQLQDEETVNFFNEKTKKPVIPHMCCVVCVENCDCGSCPEEVYKVTSDVDFDTRVNLQCQITNTERHHFMMLLRIWPKASNPAFQFLVVCAFKIY